MYMCSVYAKCVCVCVCVCVCDVCVHAHHLSASSHFFVALLVAVFQPGWEDGSSG